MKNNKFREIDPKEIDTLIRSYFSSEIRWHSEIVPFQDREFGLLTVEEQEEKPVLCKKQHAKLFREGAIYYRYRGETKEIEYSELKQLLEKEKEKERILWINNIQRIAMIGPKNVQLLDTYKGEIEVGEKKILIDKNLIDKIKFIQEGKFTEKDGEGIPTLKLVGEVEGFEMEKVLVKPDEAYPLLARDLAEKLGLNRYEVNAVLYANNVKGKTQYHAEITNGKIKIHKYNERLVEVLKRYLKNDSILSECCSKYQDYLKGKKKANQLTKQK